MNIVTILPVSRVKYIDRVFESILNQTYKINNMIVIFDGSKDDFIYARNKILGYKIDNIIIVKSNNTNRAFSMPERRQHIVDIHNQARELVINADWIFSIEDDGILPPDALRRLVLASNANDNTGIITGVELGRWGVPYVGAWTVDDIMSPKVITSIENKSSQTPFTVDNIDACGLYCALIKYDIYKNHVFHTDNGIGPDVNLCLYSKKQGYNNYIDWGIPVTHLTNNGLDIEILATDKSEIVELRLISDNTWKNLRKVI